MTCDNPCDRLEMLRARRDEIIMGNAAREVEHDTSGVGRTQLQYHTPDLKRLDAEIRAAERACRQSKGLMPKSTVLTMRG